jgi:general stress protein 26
MDNDNKDIQKLAHLVKDIKIAMLVTRENDILRSRPMATHKIEQDGLIWFFTQRNSHKIFEVTQSSSVNISYMDTDNEVYVSVSGEATIVTDKEKIEELWSPVLKAWFPKGKEDPEIALLRVEITQAEYWDAPGNNMVQIFGMVKAALTGRPYDPGENKKIRI